MRKFIWYKNNISKINSKMGKGLIFFCCSCAILLFTIINFSVGPIVTKTVGNNWGTENCQKKKDDYDDVKDQPDPSNSIKYGEEWRLYQCQRKKAMHDMEYTSFIFDIVIGFVCGLLGLLHLFELKKEFVSKTGLIGLGCGIVGFVLTFVYVVFNGIVYTNYYDDSLIYKRDSDGAFAERVEAGKYECFYFDEEGNSHALIAKYSDLIQKQYNYDKDVEAAYLDSQSEIIHCQRPPNFCQDQEYITFPYNGLLAPLHGGSECKYLYADHHSSIGEITNKDKSDRFLTTLLLSLFVCLANIGLAIFGFLLFRTPGEF